jgi:hypothetical protein
MTETWQQRFERQVREVHEALDAVLSRGPRGVELKRALDEVSQRPWFGAFAYRWGPVVWAEDRVLFRPLILAHLGTHSLDAKAKPYLAWVGPEAPRLRAWLEDADGRGDVEVFRKLYEWRLMEGTLGEFKGRKHDEVWRAELLRRVRAAKDRAARHTELGKLDLRVGELDEDTALGLYEADAIATQKFILGHLPSPWSGDRKRLEWRRLLDATRARGDEDFHFKLYRNLIRQDTWRKDVLALARAEQDASRLVAGLEARHIDHHQGTAAEVFVELAELRGEAVLPYIMKHARSAFPRWGFFGPKQAKGLPDLLALCVRQGWWDTWSKLLKTSATAELWDKEVRQLVEDRKRPEPEVRRLLSSLAGSGVEWNFAGFSLANVQPLANATAAALYARFPDLLRGPYRMHASMGYRHALPKLVAAVLAANDEDLLDFLTSRHAMLQLSNRTEELKGSVELLTRYYEALPQGAFVQRAAGVLSMIPAYTLWNYAAILATNGLTRLLFERSTPLYLGSAAAVRDLLESPEIHVQALAFRILSQPEARARAAAAASVDLLQATLLRPLHRRTRLSAFSAMLRAAEHDEATARRLLSRMREALALPDKRYPKEELIGLMGKVLHLWPALREPAEQPRVFEAAGVAR